MKNEFKKITLVTLILAGTLSQIGCMGWDEAGDYNSAEPKQSLSPSTLSTEEHNEKVDGGRCVSQRTKFLQMSDAEIYERGTQSRIGSCYLFDATDYPFHCTAYVKVSSSTWESQGWPLDPDARNSTGCVSQTQYDGYTKKMATPSLAANAVEQLRDALRNPEDVCGLCISKRKITADMILGEIPVRTDDASAALVEPTAL